MTIVNRSGDEFFPVQYPGVDYETARKPEAAAKADENELYYRQQIFPALADEVAAVQRGDLPVADLRLDAYQAWNENAWKKPHATEEAFERFAAKTDEEAREVDDAVEGFFDSKNPDHLLDEIGDYVWSITALTSNAGAVISDAIKQRLFAYLHGTKRYVYETARFVEPDWYHTVGQLAIKRGSLTFGELASIYSEGFVPHASPVMNIHEKEEICLTEYAFDFQFFGHALGFMGKRQYDVETHTLPEHRGLSATATVPEFASWEDVATDMGKVTAELYLRAGAMAHKVGSDFGAVALRNIVKVNGRVATGTVDKSDGPRA